MLEALQGDVVPRFFRQRWFGTLYIQALVTEYVGPGVTKNEDGKVLVHQAESALRALKRIHEAGVLHGDVGNLGNLVWDDSRHVQCSSILRWKNSRRLQERAIRLMQSS